MSMVGTFDGFTSARLGIYAAQHGLRVTGNNVSNINTIGYTRQRVDQMSFKVGVNDMYRSHYDNHVGAGALVTGINQIRDPYLDIRYRDTSTDTYHYDTWLSGLQNIASILDEVGKGDNEDGLIYRQIQDLAEKLRAYSADPTALNDRLVRNSAESLTALFHNAANRLEKLYNETVDEFKNNVTAVNEILLNIRDLNKSIRESEIHGDMALEMRDERNRQIDALSQYLDIKVEYSYEDVGAGIQVEKLTIKLNDANPDKSVHTDESLLVDGLYATQLSVPEQKPVLNTYTDAYLQGYTYLKKVDTANGAAVQKALDELNAKKGTNYTLEQFISLPPVTITETDEDGNEVEYYLFGTNDSDVDGIVTEKNDNFTIQLGKLLNIKDEEWKSVTTAWLEVDSATALSNAVYSFPITINEDAGGTLSFIVKDGDTETTVTIGAGADQETIMTTIANALNTSGKYPGYDISASGTNLIFTPKSNPAPTDPPTLSVTTKDGSDPWLSVGPRSTIPAETYDEHGNVIKSVDYVLAEGKWYRLTVGTTYTHEVTLDDNDLHGILQAEREMLTEEGEFASAKDVAIDESALIKRGIKYYQQSLDLLAQKFAKAYNQLNKGYTYNQDGYYIDEYGNPVTMQDADGNWDFISVNGLTEKQRLNLIANGYVLTDKNGYLVDENGSLITDEKGKPILAYQVDENGNRVTDADGRPVLVDPVTVEVLLDKGVVDMDRILKERGAHFMGGDLFTTLDGETTTGITAKNISISHGWSNGLWNLVPTYEMLFKDDGSGGLPNTTQNTNADHMVAMIEKGLNYNPRDLDGSDAIGPNLFTGSFNDMLSNMMAVQGEDADITNVRLTTFATALNELDYSREGVSGVDLNDEAMNMVTYQKAMTAAMRVMTAIDEVLDRLINNTGIAGR